jgi:hypothetical protein
MDLAELIAREAIRHTIAAYNHAGDRGRVEELAAQLTTDGVLEIKGGRTLRGRDEIADGLGRSVLTSSGTASEPRFLRHHVSSVVIDNVTADGADAASYFAVWGPHGIDHWGRYRDRFMPVGDRWLISFRTARVDARTPGSSAPLP